MAYEFTKEKIANVRRTLRKRLITAALVGCAGLALGVVENDSPDIFGIFRANV